MLVGWLVGCCKPLRVLDNMRLLFDSLVDCNKYYEVVAVHIAAYCMVHLLASLPTADTRSLDISMAVDYLWAN